MMTKCETIINDNDLRNLVMVRKVSWASFALGCYLIGQVDKWNHLKNWILLE